MKLTKKELKSILKECMREIMQEEGMLSTKSLNESRQPLNQQSNPNVPKQNNMLLEKVNNLASQLSIGTDGKNKSMFAEILADTAMNTLQKQMEPGMRGVSGLINESTYSEQQLDQEIDTLTQFSTSGNTSDWAKIAFGGK